MSDHKYLDSKGRALRVGDTAKMKSMSGKNISITIKSLHRTYTELVDGCIVYKTKSKAHVNYYPRAEEVTIVKSNKKGKLLSAAADRITKSFRFRIGDTVKIVKPKNDMDQSYVDSIGIIDYYLPFPFEGSNELEGSIEYEVRVGKKDSQGSKGYFDRLIVVADKDLEPSDLKFPTKEELSALGICREGEALEYLCKGIILPMYDEKGEPYQVKDLLSLFIEEAKEKGIKIGVETGVERHQEEVSKKFKDFIATTFGEQHSEFMLRHPALRRMPCFSSRW